MGYNMGHLLYTTNPRDACHIRGHGQHYGGAIVTDHTSDEPQTKICTKCGETKDVSAFSKDAQKSDGLQYHCKSCNAQYHEDHREYRLQSAAQWHHGHPQYDAQWYQANREEKAQYAAQWRKNNPDKCRAQGHRHRARKTGNGGTHTAADIQRQGDIQDWKCWWRGPGCAVDCKDTYDVDHIIPLDKGGHNNPSNLVISCPHCNRSKQDKLPHEWCGRLL
jgi:5-methylcytosine-specific restriction endonuclease McrA